MLALQEYGSDEEEDSNGVASSSFKEQAYIHLQQPSTSGLTTSAPLVSSVNAAPAVIVASDRDNLPLIDPTTKELKYNPKYDQLYAPVVGPVNPFKTQQQLANKNILSGFVEPAQVSDFQFEVQRRTFFSYGFAEDPTAGETPSSQIINDGRTDKIEEGITVFEQSKSKREKRKQHKNMDSSDVEGYTGPWGSYVDEEKVSVPDADTMEVLEEYARKRKKLQKVAKDDSMEEETILHIKDPYDYQGRSFLHAPHDIGVNLRAEAAPDKCFIPKKLLHTWSGHSKAVQAVRWFPKTAHLLLSCAMDAKIKLWEVYNDRRCVRTYSGHRQAVRDVTFNNDGSEFLSASYDRFIKLWDTETGECKQRFTTGKVPYCVRYNPDEDKHHFFLSGMADKKIIQWDVRSGEIVQEYDRHLGAVNTITFFDQNRRFCSTSDDKSLRIWEWEIPVDTKLIQDASLHSMPAVTMSPNQKWLACQSMDNKLLIFQIIDEKIRFHRRKQFKGHMVAGYACTTDFSPDMSYIVSGDADGRVWIWNWKSQKASAKWKAHDNVCIATLWHPHETSKLVTAGWDGLIKYWD